MVSMSVFQTGRTSSNLVYCSSQYDFKIRYIPRQLSRKNIVWLRNKERFLYVYKDKQHYYTPDFYLPDANEYIEIKGYKTGKDYAKWKQFPKDKKLTVLAEKELLSLGIQL